MLLKSYLFATYHLLVTGDLMQVNKAGYREIV
jgi:hypothetical protein